QAKRDGRTPTHVLQNAKLPPEWLPFRNHAKSQIHRPPSSDSAKRYPSLAKAKGRMRGALSPRHIQPPKASPTLPSPPTAVTPGLSRGDKWVVVARLGWATPDISTRQIQQMPRMDERSEDPGARLRRPV